MIKRLDTSGIDLLCHVDIKFFRQCWRRPNDQVAAIRLIQCQGLQLVGQEDEIHVVGFAVFRQTLGVNDDRVTRHQVLQLAFHVLQLTARHHFIGHHEQLHRGPVVELRFKLRIADYIAVFPVDFLDDFLEKEILAGTLIAMHDDRRLHLRAAMTHRIGQPAQHP